jgi:tRNA dimethylallyltransferase
MLRELDPVTAARLSPKDRQRIVRAIEVALATGRPLSDEIAASPFGPDRFRAVKVGLKMRWEVLTARIEARVDAFFVGGIVEEVRRLLASGVPQGANCFKALGYREVIDHLDGRVSLEETIALVKRNTRRYAKRQMTWFRREPGLIWYDVGERAEESFADIEREIAPPTGAGGSGDGYRQPE